MRVLVTTAGRLQRADVGLILPHEHIVTDLRTPDTPGHGRADRADVVAVMAPALRAARAAGVTALVEATPLGVGRRADLVTAAARAAGLPVVLATGVYREPWIPTHIARSGDDELVAWMTAELRENVDGSDVPAGWVKLSAGDDGLTALETRILRAAAEAARQTGAAVGSHTIRGRVVLDQLAELAAVGFPADRFVWIHAQEERDLGVLHEVASTGVWLSLDNIGWGDDDRHLELLTRLASAGLVHRLLVSQDRGWYDPGRPGGGELRPYDHLVTEFLPRLRAAGWDGTQIARLTVDNPFEAFARPSAGAPERGPLTGSE
jgi:phosphotriesterase-related protein